MQNLYLLETLNVYSVDIVASIARSWDQSRYCQQTLIYVD